VNPSQSGPPCQEISSPTSPAAVPVVDRSNRIRTTILAILFAILLEYVIFLSGAYLYMARQNRRRAAMQAVAPHDRPIAPLDRLKGSGRIYLVAVGTLPYSLDPFAEWLRSKYQLDVQLLPAMNLDPSTWDPSRRQYVGESLHALIRREHPQLAADPQAYLIGFTDASMYSIDEFWSSSFTQRDHLHRAAIISSADIRDTWMERIGVDPKLAEQHLQQRLRRILLKDVAILYWHLPMSHDSSSLMHWTVDPNLPTEDIYLSDLDPLHTPWGQLEGEPCIFLRYTPEHGLRPWGDLVRSCYDQDETLGNEAEETFEFSLRYGVLSDRHTDFYLQDSIPIRFERVTRDGWRGPQAFGFTGTHNYDQYLISEDGMASIDVVRNDGSRFHLTRQPAWLPLLSFNKYVDTDFSGRKFALRWSLDGYEHFELKRYDREVETYLPCDDKVVCYEIGYRSPEGQQLQFQRDKQRRLNRLTSPGNQWLEFTYGPANHITGIRDSRGREVSYEYDDRNRLVSVTYPSGTVHRYQYDDQQHLLVFSVAPDAKTTPRTMLRNTYENGRLATQDVTDVGVYRYSYDTTAKNKVTAVFVSTPDGRTFAVTIVPGNSIVREHTLAPAPLVHVN
jgi:YD repeat-containing protein